jgi:hypothetical protein
MLLKA